MQIKDIKEDIEYYLETCREPDFEENELLYEDIDGLDDMLQEISNVSHKRHNFFFFPISSLF